MGKGSQTTQTTQSGSSTVSPDSNAYQAYLALLNRASGVASTPYQGFSGEEVAPVNAQQTTGVGNINTAQGNIAGMGPISAADIQRYSDPYTNQVINATQADFDTQNQRAQSQVTGNAAAQGALGGDRVGVAQALTAEGQARVQAPVIAGLRSQGYQNAVNTAENQQKFGLTAQEAALQGAQSQIGAGTLEQQTKQAQDTQARQDYYQAQGYPFQVAQWLAGIDTAVGGSMGSSSTSTGQATTQAPTPNPWTQVAGLGLSAASLFAKDGGRITERRAGLASGGTPYSGLGPTWVPTADVRSATPTAHANLPSAPQAAKQQGLTPDQMKGIGVLGKQGAGLFDSASYGGGNFLMDAYGGSSSSPLEGLSASDYGEGYYSGGRIKRYASGGFADGGSPKDESYYGEDTSSLGNQFSALYREHYPNMGPSLAEKEKQTSSRIKKPSRSPFPGFADGGAPDFSERFDAAYPNMAAGVGASRPAFEAGPTYDDGGGPFRLSNPEDLDAWRARVDRDNGRKITAAAAESGLPPPTQVATSSDEVPALPDEVTAGVSRPRMTASAAAPSPADEGTEALGYSAAPPMRAGVGAPQNLTATEQEKPGGILNALGIKMTPELRQGLLQAGLSMMATTRGGPGSFLGSLGEAGMAGVGAYSKSQEMALKQAQMEREQAIENEKLKMAGETHQQQMAATPILADGTVNPAWVAMKQKESEITQKDNWSQVGYVTTGEGENAKVHPLVMNKTDRTVIDAITGKPPKETDTASKTAPSGAVMDDQTAEFLADRVRAGDSRALVGLGRGAQGAENLLKVQQIIGRQEREGKPVSDAARNILANAAQQAGFVAAERTQAQIMAKLSVYGRTAYNAMDLALKASDAVPRTEFPKVNEAVNAFKSNTGDPKIKAFGQAVETLTNEYARAIGGGHGTVTDKEHARDRLNTAQTPDQFKAVVDMMKQEIVLAEHAMPEAREQIKGIYNPTSKGPAPSIEGGIKPPAGAVARKDKEGKTWYFDPITKQPLPGQ